MKRILIAVAGLLLLLLVGAVIAPTFIDWNKYRPEIARRIEAETGRAVAIQGDLSFRLLPSPALRVGRISLANVAGASEPEMVSLKSMDVRVALLPLLGGRIQVDRLRLVDPVVSLEVLSDGRRNWDFSSESGTSTPAIAASRKKRPPGAGANVSLDSVQIAGGLLRYRDASGNIVEQFDKIDANLRVRTLSGPYTASGTMLLHSVPLRFELALGRLDAAEPAELGGSIEVPSAKARLRFSGQLANPLTAPKLHGQLRCDIESINALAAALHVGLSATRRPGTIEARLRLDAHELSLDDLTIQLADTSATGALNMSLGAEPNLNATLRINLLDLDTLVPPAQVLPTAAGVPPAATSAPAPAWPASGLYLPPGWRGNLNLTIAALAWRGNVMRQVALAAALHHGSLEVSSFTALLPGGAEAELSGRLAATGNGPRFDGKVKADADNLRAVLDWLNVNVAAVPIDRLLRLHGTALLAVTPELLQIANLDATVDSSHLVGAINIALRARPSFGAKLDVDRVNLQAYMPVPQSAAAGAASSSPAAIDRNAAPSASGWAPLALLAKFDAIALVHVGELTWNQVPVRDLSLNVKLVGAQLTVNQLHVADAGGVDIALSGTARSLSGSPSYDFKLGLQAPTLAGLGRLIGGGLPAALTQAGGFALQTEISGAPGTAELHGMKLQLGKSDLAGDVTARFDADRPKVTAKLSGNNVLLDQLLPVAAASLGAGPVDNAPEASAVPVVEGSSGASRGGWTAKPFDVSALTLLDADISATAHHLVYQDYDLSDASFALTLDNGVADLRQLRGRLFDGALDSAGKLTATGTPSFTLQLKLADADLEQALSRLAGIKAISGRFALQGTFSSQGRSQADLVQHLAGEAAISAHDGGVRGLDLKTLSDQLKQLKSAIDLPNLLRLGLSGGQTGLTSANGNWLIQQGLARTDDTVAQLDAAAASLTGVVNLPAWSMDLKSAFKLTDHPQAPAFLLDLTGPLDQPRAEAKVDDLRQFLLQRLGSRPLKGSVGNDDRRGGSGVEAQTNPGGPPSRAAANGSSTGN